MNTDVINYDELLFLDAENLAEVGMAEGYEQIKTEFGKRKITLSSIEEIVDDEHGTYHVKHAGKTYCIYSGKNDTNSWSNATVALFEIVNSQLQELDLHLYALNGGNDLCGTILTESEFAKAREQLISKTDWPYIPEHGDDWLGQPH